MAFIFNNSSELTKLKSEIKKLKNEAEIINKENKILKKNNKAKDEVIEDLDRNNYKDKYRSTVNQLKVLEKMDKEKEIEIEELKKKVSYLEGRLATQNVRIKKDSSNSSKPSGTNEYKKVITNRREKSTKKPGGQRGHKGAGLTAEKIDKIIQSGEAEVTIIEVNKTEYNKDKEPKIRKVVDIKIIETVTIYKYYPDPNGIYDIPQEHNSPVQYGPTIKAMSTDLLISSNNSTDAVKKFLSSISNNRINLSKGTLINWLELCAEALSPQLISIQERLLISYYANVDEVTIKINGEQKYGLCVSNKEVTRLWISDNKSKDAIDAIDFLTHFTGILIKDGTALYNSYGKVLAQCISHILRYIKGIYDFNAHKYPKEMSQFLQEVLEEREKYIEAGKKKFEDQKYKEYMRKFKKIFSCWKKEWMKSNEDINPVYDAERKLLQRFEDGKELKEILYFMIDFKIPATNNQAEADQRPIKIKQKIGKFRSKTGAECYAEIRSCINTYKKQGYSPFKMLLQAFKGEPQII